MNILTKKSQLKNPIEFIFPLFQSSFHPTQFLAMTDSAGANISASNIQSSSKSAANNAKEEEKRKTVAESIAFSNWENVP
jgi:hypothetical protein